MYTQPGKLQSPPFYVLKFKQIKERLEKLLRQESYNAISVVQKSTSSQLLYFINFYKSIGVEKGANLRKCLRDCLQIVITILGSTEFEKYSHIFPIFSFVVRRFQQYFCEKINVLSMQDKLKRASKNQQSQLYNNCKPIQISIQEHKLLASPLLPVIFQNITENMLLLQDPQCIGCSQVFTENVQITNKNSFLSIFTDPSLKTGVDRLVLQRYLNAVCNHRGGVILVGVEKKGQIIKPVGVKYNSFKDIQEDYKGIANSVQMIKPQCLYKIQRIKVYPHFSNQLSTNDTQIRICFRITIHPIKITTTSYIEINVKGYQDSYEINCLNSQKKPFKLAIDAQNSIDGSFYSVIHENYYKQLKQPRMKNSHRNILCMKPIKQLQWLENWKEQKQVKKDPDEIVYKAQNQEIIEEIKFKYQYTTLIVVPSKNFNREVNKFAQGLENSKQVFQATRPYQKHFNADSARSVWMISHQITTSKLKQILTNYVDSGFIKKGTLKLMPVQKRLQIQGTKLTKEKRRLIEKRLKQRLKCDMQIQEVELKEQQKQIKEITMFFTFDGFSESILAYMILEQMQVRAYFVREGEKYVKKGCQNQDQ